MPLKWFLYHAGVRLYTIGIYVSSMWDEKSRQWINGRKEWKQRLKQLPKKKSFRIWFHVASLGEFEQAKPVIEEIKRRYENTELILTFFSPSGYEMKKHYQAATVLYLPADVPGNAKIFIDSLEPDLVVFTKYDLWPGYIDVLLKKKIRTILISAYWSKERRFASWKNPLNRSLLQQFDHIFLQKGSDLSYIKSLGFNNVSIAGDTRIDRSLHLPLEIQRIPTVLHNAHYDIVAGSTWPGDESIILPVIRDLHLRAIIAPHDVSTPNIKRLVAKITVPYQRLSTLEPSLPHQVLIIDSIGYLAVLYALGDISYVGGGFGDGIHNILEPASHGKPVIFGPRYKKFPEAIDLLTKEAAISITTESSLKDAIMKLKEVSVREPAGKKAFDYLSENSGATNTITDYIMELMPTNQPA